MEIKWTNKNDEMPKRDKEIHWVSKSVLVTDGVNWGHGRFDNDCGYWVYNFVGRVESSDNNITHWAYIGDLPGAI